MPVLPFANIQSRIRARSRSWSHNISDSLRRCCQAIAVVSPLRDDTSSRSSARTPPPTRCVSRSNSPLPMWSGSSSGISTPVTSSPTRSTFSKKGSRFFKKSMLRRKRESRDDFGNRWSKIYIPGHSRSATPLPDVVYHGSEHHDNSPSNRSMCTVNTSRDAFEREGIEFIQAGFTYLHLNMSMYDEEYDLFGQAFDLHVGSDPNLYGNFSDANHPLRRTFSWRSLMI